MAIKWNPLSKAGIKSNDTNVRSDESVKNDVNKMPVGNITPVVPARVRPKPPEIGDYNVKKYPSSDAVVRRLKYLKKVGSNY